MPPAACRGIAGCRTRSIWSFVLARYKHVAKLLVGKERVLEIGCADGFGSHIVAQHVGRLTAIDSDPLSIAEAQRGAVAGRDIDFVAAEFMLYPVIQPLDAVYALDVLEHVPPDDEYVFLSKLADAAPVAVIGTPSLESQAHASELSRAGHVNCKTGPALRKLLARHWRHVFLFSMNDETLHTGFEAMAHYRLALCVN
jgi:2-polyprenyl-3-methyl-5-hydroxy-6-metoxy-1,4-benzoquinol methylase